MRQTGPITRKRRADGRNVAALVLRSVAARLSKHRHIPADPLLPARAAALSPARSRTLRRSRRCGAARQVSVQSAKPYPGGRAVAAWSSCLPDHRI